MKKEIKFKKFNFKRDYERCIQFLTDCYLVNKNMSCWLPQRLDDLIFRLDNQSKKKSANFIHLCEEAGKIVALIIPDEDSFNSCIKRGYEHIFGELVDFAEKNLAPLFDQNEDKTINFLVVAHDSMTYQAEELKKRGYTKEKEQDYDNVQYPLENEYKITLPKGFHQSYGENLDKTIKSEACHYGFHPADDDGVLTHYVGKIIPSVEGREKSRYFKDSLESLIVTDDGDICSYCFCYVDKKTRSAFIEPVSTREKYRHMGFCRQMINGVMIRLKEMGIENCYINSYDWRRNVYARCGFKTEDSIGYWRKKISIDV